MDVFPDFDGLAGIGDLEQVIGALLTIVLVVAVLMIVVSAICWALGASHGNHSLASKGRVGVLVGAGAAVLAGAGVAWVNWLIVLGRQL
ncbi:MULTISPECIES: DUF6112 family protein [Micrococcales]|uniref:Integral membrane protein n=2 Tax=Micrococcales TaxID=85006 RepID=K1E375_9MICO|nr:MULTISPECIES: DUF6112 family protein [Micrococcales]MBX3079092.1 hypothetical protein [Cryobacterium sp.]EKA61476.1 hypothetical protein B277_07151 [Janibacter hoylei PVAS-1]MCL6423336.1 DUF6112 family protein [Brachybacterium equifaecis]NHC30735.1 hypothetical protein [Dermacoccus nishinomiyaensis]RWU83607.1 hypothetical protein CWN80_07495 [Janibacter hoylei PVAS-1]